MPLYRLFVSRFVFLIAFSLSVTGCSESVDSYVVDGEAALARGDYRTALVNLKSALQQVPGDTRARWLLGEVYLELEDGPSAEKEIRRAMQGGVGPEAALPALARALLLQDDADAVLKIEIPAGLAEPAMAEMLAAQAVAHLKKDDVTKADELSARALEMAPDAKLVLSSRARLLAEQRQFDRAMDLIVRLQEAFPDFGVAWSLAGDIEDLRGDPAAAETAYSAAIDKRVINHGDRVKRALVRLRQNELDGALEDALLITKSIPQLQQAWYVVGAVHYLRGNYATAKDSLQEAYQLDNNDIRSVLFLGWTNLMVGNLNQSAAQADRAMVIASELVPSRLLTAAVRLRQGRPDEAEQLLRPLASALPDNLVVKGLLISSLQAQDRGDEAVPLLEQARAIAPDSADLQELVGLELVRAQDFGKASQVFDRLSERVPLSSEAHNARISALIKNGELDSALDLARKFREQEPNNPMALQTLGVAQAALGEIDAATESFRAALNLKPGDLLASLKLAELLRLTGDLEGASAVVATAAEFHPADLALMTFRARLALMQGNNAGAVELLRQAVAQSPHYVPALVLLSGQLLAQGDAVGALAVLPTRTNLDNPALLKPRAEARLRVGDLVAARDDYVRLISLLPESADAHLNLGLAHAALGDSEGRYQALDQAARLDPTSETIGLVRARSLVDRGRSAEALSVARGFDLADSDPRLLALKLYVAEVAGDLAERLRLAKELQVVAPSELHTLQLARAHYAGGDMAAVERVLRQWLDSHPEADRVAVQLVALYGRTGRTSKAIEILRRLVDKYPEDPIVLNDLAWYLRDTAAAESLLLAERAARIAPDNPTILDTYASVLATDGQYERALGIIDDAIAQDPGEVLFGLRRIEILAQAGEHASARRELETLNGDAILGAHREWIEALRQQTELR